MPTVYERADGSRSVATTVLILEDLRKEAKKQRICLSSTLQEALQKKLEDQGEQLAGNLAPGHHRGLEYRGAVNSERECT